MPGGYPLLQSIYNPLGETEVSKHDQCYYKCKKHDVLVAENKSSSPPPGDRGEWDILVTSVTKNLGAR